MKTTITELMLQMKRFEQMNRAVRVCDRIIWVSLSLAGTCFGLLLIGTVLWGL